MTGCRRPASSSSAGAGDKLDQTVATVSASWTARRVFASEVDILTFGDVGEEEHSKPMSKRGCISRI